MKIELRYSSLVAGRLAEAIPVCARKCSIGFEAAGESDLGVFQFRLQQQSARAIQTKIAVEDRRRAIQMPVEQPFELSARASDLVDNAVNIQWFLEIRFHQLHGMNEMGASCSQANLQGKPLALVLGANPRMQDLLGDSRSEAISMARGKKGHHHIDSGGFTGAGEAIPVDFEKAFTHQNFGERFPERFQGFPVNGCPVAIQHAGFGKNTGRGAQTANHG